MAKTWQHFWFFSWNLISLIINLAHQHKHVRVFVHTHPYYNAIGNRFSGVGTFPHVYEIWTHNPIDMYLKQTAKYTNLATITTSQSGCVPKLDDTLWRKILFELVWVRVCVCCMAGWLAIRRTIEWMLGSLVNICKRFV